MIVFLNQIKQKGLLRMNNNTFSACQEEDLREWSLEIATQMPQLSWAQVYGLAMWSFGMFLAQSSGLTCVTAVIAGLLRRKEANVRQQLREWYCEPEAKNKKGKQRRNSLEVRQCFKPLLKWVVSRWCSADKRLALAMDASSLSDKFTVLAISVVYRGCAIPVAWKIVKGSSPGEWRPHWEELFEELRGAVPTDWTVIVLADRGLYARWLYQKIVELKWHPFLRLNVGGMFQVQGQARWRELKSAAPRRGVQWSGRVKCFKGKPVEGTLLACWDEVHTDPWLILTDLKPEEARVCWYGLRFWIEVGFKQNKRGGWQWQQTRMEEPGRAERKWLAMAVATLLVVSAGGEGQEELPKVDLSHLPLSHIARRVAKNKTKPRVLNSFRRGLIRLWLKLKAGERIGVGWFVPEEWPSVAFGVSISLDEEVDDLDHLPVQRVA
jgi:hypothetical protein